MIDAFVHREQLPNQNLTELAVCTRVELVSLAWQANILTDELTDQKIIAPNQIGNLAMKGFLQ